MISGASAAGFGASLFNAFDGSIVRDLRDGFGQSATDDFDKDGTSNLTEYRLGLVPNGGSSLFLATRAANGLIRWPSAVGLKFDVQRGTSLFAGSWTTISPAGGIDGAAVSTGFTDSAAPAGKAFYKVLLRP
ncbi:MAG: hypothetical protein ABIS50_26585 [Luteolibacter sp.]|uniref:hypothetical protein n=1 Tax=Luteolibacter sp. TaxID=1962973 RepID=UPI003264C0A4